MMEKLGSSLHTRLKHATNFTMATTLMVGMQVLERLKLVHSCRIVHNDLKPDNLMLGCHDDRDTVYLIDFGLATLYKEKGVHLDRENVGHYRGTRRYSSVNNMRGLTTNSLFSIIRHLFVKKTLVNLEKK